MAARIHDLYVELKKYVESLEEDVKKSLEMTNYSENVVALETSKDYHYKEILSQLQQIKDHIKIISNHSTSIDILQDKISGTKIDKFYIKKQVETFQNIGNVNRREKKLVRPRETSSSKFLECWERLMEDQENNGSLFVLPQRTACERKQKRIVSSTVDAFLDGTGKSYSFESLLEETPEDISRTSHSKSLNDLDCFDEEQTDSKPRIVDVIYKKTAQV